MPKKNPKQKRTEESPEEKLSRIEGENKAIRAKLDASEKEEKIHKLIASTNNFHTQIHSEIKSMSIEIDSNLKLADTLSKRQKELEKLLDQANENRKEILRLLDSDRDPTNRTPKRHI